MVEATTLDQDELQEWLESLEDVIQHKDVAYAKALLNNVIAHYHNFDSAGVFGLVSCTGNSIRVDQQGALPEGLDLSIRAHQYILWNAMVMVVRAGHQAPELGGHIATFASSAMLYTVGFDYFFRQDTPDQLGDIVYFQGHASPGMYARSFLEGRFDAQRLDYFRREAGKEPGLSSYPHPHLMPDYWQFPTVSMGLGPLQAIYQARWQRYLYDRLGVATQQRHVWAFCGDGEMDEPESRGCLQMAARESLDNLIFVVNCNLQRLDGPVRGNGSIIQELEAFFKGAQWHVIKVLHNSAWDEVFAKDPSGKLQKAMAECVDGQLQTLSARGPRALLDHIAGSDPELQVFVQSLADDLVAQLAPGGHDAKKIYHAYAHALEHRGSPVVILAHTIKGYGLGEGIAAANTTHQQKKMSEAALSAYAQYLSIPLDQKDIITPCYYHPGAQDPAVTHIKQRRQQLGGYMPSRRVVAAERALPDLGVLAELLGASDRAFSTTMAFVRILSIWLRQPDFAPCLVPIVPDESRTFGMEGLFRQIGIYTSEGQRYEPVDKSSIMYYKESAQGQLLQEGINEAGAMASWLAAATSYSTNGVAMLPMYIFYSMFGFQRVGDLLWACADMHARGFLLGATAGRTTLAGEGLQHNDGQSHIMAALIPNCVSYDPCYAYELAVIIQSGSDRMYQRGEDVFYYITLMNENYTHRAMPESAYAGIVQGMYLLEPSKSQSQIHLLGSGAILREVEQAAAWLSAQGLGVQVWSVTSFTELARAAEADPEQAYVTSCLDDTLPVVAATDYVKQYAEQIRPYIKNPYRVLGTDGFGRSDTRANLRAYFSVSSHAVATCALGMLLDTKAITKAKYQRYIQLLDTEDLASWEEGNNG